MRKCRQTLVPFTRLQTTDFVANYSRRTEQGQHIASYCRIPHLRFNKTVASGVTNQSRIEFLIPSDNIIVFVRD